MMRRASLTRPAETGSTSRSRAKQGLRPGLLELGLQAAADCGVGARELKNVQGCPHVEAGSARQDGALAAGVDAADDLPGLLLEVRNAGFLGDVQGVQEVVGHAAPFGRGDLGGTDVHAPVELHGIGIDHLAVQLECKADRKIGLT